MTTTRAPADKLTLTARKNIRDEWEPKKPELEAAMHDILGQNWTMEWNPNLIVQYAEDDWKSRLGEIMFVYMEAFVDNLKRFANSFGADGIQELNSLCDKHQVLLTPQEETDFTYGGLVVEEGILQLVFAEDCLVVNVDDVSSDFAEALKKASPASSRGNALNLVARNAVRQDYDPEVEKLRSAIASLVNMPHLKLNPSFDANAAELIKSPTHVAEGWDSRIGWITLDYFKGLKDVLERQNFKDDDMQQEAFQEAVEKSEICIRVLPEWQDGQSRYNEVKVEEGILYIQTTTENWGANVDDAALGLLDIL